MKFCHKHGMTAAAASNMALVSSSKIVDRTNFLRRILYDDSRSVLFCFIPKVRPLILLMYNFVAFPLKNVLN